MGPWHGEEESSVQTLQELYKVDLWGSEELPKSGLLGLGVADAETTMERLVIGAASRRRSHEMSGPALGPSPDEMPFTREDLENMHLAVKGASDRASDRLRQALRHRSQRRASSARTASSLRQATPRSELTSRDVSHTCSPDLGSSCSSRAISPQAAAARQRAESARASRPQSEATAVPASLACRPLEKARVELPALEPAWRRRGMNRSSLSSRPPRELSGFHQQGASASDASAAGLFIDVEDEEFIKQNRDRANAWIAECKPDTFRLEKDKQVWEVQAEERRRAYHFRAELLKKMGSTPFEKWLGALRSVSTPRQTLEQSEPGTPPPSPLKPQLRHSEAEASELEKAGHAVFKRIFVERRQKRAQRREAAKNARPYQSKRSFAGGVF